MVNIINLTIGDWSNDGHGKTSSVTISSNLSEEEIRDAYSVGSKIVGFDLSESVCSDYQDTSLSVAYLSSLVKHGFDEQSIYGYKRNHGGFHLVEQDFVNIFLFIVKLGNSNFEFNIVKNNEICIGGYGFFE